jgi:formylmethanofuran dehydrogenase subunit E
MKKKKLSASLWCSDCGEETLKAEEKKEDRGKASVG